MAWMEPVVAKFRTRRDAEKATREYYRRLTPAERLEILFKLRDIHTKGNDASSGRLARVYRIVKLDQG
jgi:hypothetical protein